MTEKSERARVEAIAWEKVANIKKLISQYYAAEEKMASIKTAALQQIDELKTLNVDGLPPLEFPE